MIRALNMHNCVITGQKYFVFKEVKMFQTLSERKGIYARQVL